MGIQIPISQTIDNDEPGILRFGVSRAGEIPAPKKLLHPSFARQISSASLSLAAAFFNSILGLSPRSREDSGY